MMPDILACYKNVDKYIVLYVFRFAWNLCFDHVCAADYMKCTYNTEASHAH